MAYPGNLFDNIPLSVFGLPCQSHCSPESEEYLLKIFPPAVFGFKIKIEEKGGKADLAGKLSATAGYGTLPVIIYEKYHKPAR